MQVGEIDRHAEFYTAPMTGALLPKYLVVLALPDGGDIVARLITSQHEDARPKQPPCHHGAPYPGFFFGVIGEPLMKNSWLDLRPFDDLDIDVFRGRLRKGVITRICVLDNKVLRAALECVANSDDTTRWQERCIRDAMAKL